MAVASMQGNFRGLASEQHASRLSATQASDLLDVDVRDGSLRSRDGFDVINSTTIKDLVAFDRMDRANTIASAGSLTSGHLWTGIPTDDGTIDFEVWNGTLRGANEGTGLESAAVLTEANGSTNPLAGAANVAVEFDIRKYQGFGNTLRAFASDVNELLGRFSIILRTDVTDYLGGTPGGTVGDDGYEVEFVVPIGLEGGVNQAGSGRNSNMRWNDIDVEIFRRDDGVGRTTLGSSTAVLDGGPGVDEWMHVRIRVFGVGATINVAVDVNGSQIAAETDTSGSRHTAAGFCKIRCKAAGSATNEKKLKRQIQIANFQVYTLDESGDPSASALRIENIHRHTQANGDAYLIAHALTADGALLAQRPAGDGSTVSAVFYSMQPGFATDNSDLVVLGLKLNRRNGYVTAKQPTLNFVLGSDRFTITDTETGQQGLGNYTFTAGDRLHLIGAFASTTCNGASSATQKILTVNSTTNFKVGQVVRIDPGNPTGDEEIHVIASIQAGTSLTMVANLVNAQVDTTVVVSEEPDDTQLKTLPGFFEVLAAPVSNVLTVLGVPSVTASLTSVGVVYRIVSKHQGEGIAGLMNNNTDAADFARANAMTYIADGSDRVHRVNGEAVYQAGIVAPTVTPLQGNTGSGGGIMNGDTYAYRFTFFSPFLGLESSASPAATASVITDEGFLTLHGAQNDNQFGNNATHLRLYRLNSTDSETQYFRSRELPIPIDNESGIIIVEDRTADGDQSTTLTIPEQLIAQSGGGTPLSDFAVNNPPPKAILLAWRQERMFYVTANSTRLWFSASGVPDYVSPFDFVEVGRNDGEVIRAILKYREQLIILKDRSLWVLVGETRGTFQVQRMSNEVGCSSHRAVAEADDGLLYFAGELGIHRWNGQFSEDLHFGIRSTYYGLNQDRLKHMAMAVDPEDQRIILSVTQTARTEQDRWLVINYRRPDIQVEGGIVFDWTLWGIEATCFELDPMVGGASDPYRRKLRFGRTGGVIATFRGDDGTKLTDNGTGITWFWEGPKLGIKTGRNKRFKYLTIELEKTSVSSDIQVGFKIDEETAATVATFDQSAVTRKLIAVRRRGHYLRPRFSGSASTVQTRILTYALDFDHIGRR